MTRPPALLAMAACVAGIEALLLVGQGVAELASVSGDRTTMGVSTGLFFLAYGAGLGFAAWCLASQSSWARAPVVLAQLIQLLVAWSFLGGTTTPVAVGLAVLAALVLVGIFAPSSLAALADQESET